MGSYTIFDVGTYHCEFKYHIPYFLLFIFSEQDFYKEKDKDRDWFSFLGYITTVTEALKKLEKAGYTDNFFLEITEEIYGKSHKGFNESLWERAHLISNGDTKRKRKIFKELRKRAESIRNFGKYNFKKEDSAIKQFAGLIKYLKTPYGRKNFYNLLISEPIKPLGNISEKEIIKHEMESIFPHKKSGNDINIENFCYEITKFPDKFGRKIFMLCDLFLYQMEEYSDILNLAFANVLLLAAPRNAQVSVDLSDIIDADNPTEAIDSAKKMKEWVSNEIITKIRVYNKSFKVLLDGGEDQKIDLSKKFLKKTYESLENANRNEKGELFETFLASIFSSGKGIEVISRRLNLRDQEIDIVLANNISQPFFQNYQSPHILVEAKYTSNPVGTSSIRDFRAKLEDHAHTCKIGLFFSLGGFSKEALSSLRRSPTGPTIILINRSTIDAFLSDDLSLLDWLRRTIARNALV